MENTNVRLVIGISLSLVLAIFFGRWTAKQEYITQINRINKLQDALDVCQNMWKLEKDLFFPELCQTVCVEEFEKMSC